MGTIEDKISNILKKEGGINPSPDFTDRSRRLILEHGQRRPSFIYTLKHEFIENMKFGVALALATFLLFVIFSGFTYWGTLFPGATFESGTELLEEAKQVSIQIEFQEAKYFDESEQEITAMLQGIQDTETSIDTALDTLLF